MLPTQPLYLNVPPSSKSSITITSSQKPMWGHFKTLFVADCWFSIRERADIISGSLRTVDDIGTTSGCKAITAFLISGHESQAVIRFVESQPDIQIRIRWHNWSCVSNCLLSSVGFRGYWNPSSPDRPYCHLGCRVVQPTPRWYLGHQI